MKFILFILSFFLFIQAGLSQSPKWEKKKNKAEAYYLKGDYKQASFILKRLKKSQLKHQIDLDLLSVTTAMQAQNFDALGKTIIADSLLMEADSLMIKGKQDSIWEGKLIMAESFFRIGNIRRAQEYLTSFQVSIPDSIQNYKMLAYRASALQLEIYRSNYQYNQAIQLADSIIGLHIPLAEKKQWIQDVKTDTLILKRVGKKKRAIHMTNLANALKTKANLARLSGEFTLADSLYKANEKSLKKLVGKRGKAVVENKWGYALYYHDQQEFKRAAQRLRKTRFFYSNTNKYTLPNRAYLHMIQDESIAYLLAGDLRKYDVGVKEFKRDALKTFGRKSAHFVLARSLELEEYIYRGEIKKAKKKGEKLYTLLDQYYPENHKDRLVFYNQLIIVSILNNNFAFTRELLAKSENIVAYNHGINTPVYHYYKLKTGDFEVKYANDYQRADTLFGNHFDTLARVEWKESHNEFIKLLNDYAEMYHETDRLELAAKLYQEAVVIIFERFGAVSIAYGEQLAKLARVKIDQGEYAEAEKLLEQSVEAIKGDHGRSSLIYAATLRSLGELYQINGKYDLASSTLKKAFRINKRYSKLNVVNNMSSPIQLAEVYIQTGKYNEAEEILKKAIAKIEKKYGNEHFQLLDPVHTLSRLYFVKGDYVKAEKEGISGMKMAEKLLSDSSSKYLENVVLLGDVYREMGDKGKAFKHYDLAITSLTKTFGQNHLTVAELELKKANILLFNGLVSEELLAKLDEAISSIATNLDKNHPKYASALELRGRCYVQLKDYDKALIELNEAYKIHVAKFGKNHVNVANNFLIKGDMYYAKGYYKNAVTNYDKALDLYKSLFGEQHPRYTKILSKKARAFYANKEYKQAKKVLDLTTDAYLKYIRNYFPSLSESEKNKYWNSIRGDFEIYNSLAVKYYKENPTIAEKMLNNELATKAILLSSSIKIRERILKFGSPYEIDLFEEWSEKRELLTSSLSLTNEELKASQILPSKLLKDINYIEKELSESALGFERKTNKKPITWKQVKKKLKPGEAAVEVVRFQAFENNFIDSVIYVAMIFDKKSKYPTIVELEKGSDLEGKYYKYYRNNIQLKGKDKYSYKKFWKAIDEHLSGVKTVFFSGDGIYNQLNPESFRLADGQYLFDKYDLVNISNIKEIVIARREDRESQVGKSAEMYGNPSFSDVTVESEDAMRNAVSSVENLPGAEKEVNEIAGLLKENNWQSDLFVQSVATEAQIKQTKSPRVLHIATHGFFMEDASMSKIENSFEIQAENPLLKSGLLFSGAAELLKQNNVFLFNRKDGILTAYEAMNMNLDNTELVVLSACETGLGEVIAGEGVYGLQRSFLVAGAQNVIMTLFKVNDRVTQELMNAFYKKWIETGDKRIAFRYAKNEIKKKYEEPIYWGSFVMIGMD